MSNLMPDFTEDRPVIFQDLNPSQMARLSPLFISCKMGEGETVFEQGEQANNLFILVEGEVAVRFKPDDGPELTLARVKTGGVVGWSAALGSPCYTSSVDCLSDCRMLRINGCELADLCEHDPETGSLILERLAVVISERLRNTHSQVMALLEQGVRLNSRKSLGMRRLPSQVYHR